MNNKGFAITSILYGLLVMFLLIVVGTLGILSNQKKMMEELIDGDSGARDIVSLKTIELTSEMFPYSTSERALYVYNGCKKYFDSGETISLIQMDINQVNSGCIE